MMVAGLGSETLSQASWSDFWPRSLANGVTGSNALLYIMQVER